MRAPTRCLLARLLPLAVVYSSAGAAYGGFIRQTIQNNTGQAVNDLVLAFDKEPSGAPNLWRSGLGDGDDVNEASDRVAGTLSASGLTAAWPQNSFGTLAAGGKADIDIAFGGKPTRVERDFSFWTSDGQNVGPISLLGSMELGFDTATDEGHADAREPRRCAADVQRHRRFPGEPALELQPRRLLQPP